MTKYSIILPLRNGGALLKECVLSILAQSYKDFELLVLDNHSSDGSLEWIASLNDLRVIIHTSDKDLSIIENWARIKDIPKKKFITLIGHDDVLYPQYLSEMDRLIGQHPDASLYQAHYYYIDAKGDRIRPCMPMDEKQSGHEFLACQMVRTIDSTGTGYLMRSADFDKLGGMPENYPNLIYADYALWLKLSLISYKATSQEFCFSYRVHQSASTLTNGEDYQQAFGEYIHFLSVLRNEHPSILQVIDHYSYGFLMHNCESLSHRILKTPVTKRTITVKAFIKKCEAYAALLIPGQRFDPKERKRIRLAQQLDSNVIGRSVFKIAKKILQVF